jgi:hypothetical protein
MRVEIQPCDADKDVLFEWAKARSFKGNTK